MFRIRPAYYMAFAVILFSPTVSSATWNHMAVGMRKAMYFFDADTVEKKADSVTLWVKTVQISGPDSQGAWSTATRFRFNCPARTFQSLAFSDYDKEQNVITIINKRNSAAVVVPDTTGEELLNIVCERNFPRDTSGKRYSKVRGNDVFQERDDYLRYLNSKADTTPKENSGE